MNPLALAHVSDLHLPFEPRLSIGERLSKRQLSAWSWRRRSRWQRPEVIEALVADLRAQPVDHIVITGDVVNFSLPGEFESAARWLEQLAPPEQISLVPGNHDALVRVADDDGLGRWARWTRAPEGWPFVHRVAGVALIGLNSAQPTAPLLAQGALGAAQLARLERVLEQERDAGSLRVVLLHHPVAQRAVSWRKALSDAKGLRAALRRAGAELVLHGHAREARFDALPGPHGSIPVLCVPSSSALPNRHDEGARWHRIVLSGEAGAGRADVEVRRWSCAQNRFESVARYTLLLPRRPVPAQPRAAHG